MSCRLQYPPRPCGRAPRPHVLARGNLGKASRTSLPDSKTRLIKMDSTGFHFIHKDQLVDSVNTRACRVQVQWRRAPHASAYSTAFLFRFGSELPHSLYRYVYVTSQMWLIQAKLHHATQSTCRCTYTRASISGWLIFLESWLTQLPNRAGWIHTYIQY